MSMLVNLGKNDYMVVGEVVTEPKFYQVKGGTLNKTKLCVAYETERDQDGGLVTVNCWKGEADRARLLRKGDKIIAWGVMVENDWQGKKTNELNVGGIGAYHTTFYSPELITRHINGKTGEPAELITPKTRADKAAKAKEKAEADWESISADDLPF